MFSDGGGKRQAGLKPLFGQEKVLTFLTGILQHPENQRHEFFHQPAFVNGRPASLIFHRKTGELDSVTYLGGEATAITRLLYLRNPDKLRIRTGK
ncbi:hypothetical protein GCM10027299_13370 [Larkinella ripae]